ncbi:MAG: hypothetical protein WC469_02440 [Candidatus Omnitrophota bacterium]|jgi:hypothetical protein
MDEVIFVEVLRIISIVAIVTGALAGLDLVSGARGLSAFNRISAKSITFDSAINNSKARVGLGITFLVASSFSLLAVLAAR